MKRIIIALLLIIVTSPVFSSPYEQRTTTKPQKYYYHEHNESSYQHAYCSAVNGVEEYELPDKTRVDCLTNEYAIEFDFCVPGKIYESVGQALYYGLMTNRKPKVVLILDRKHEEQQKKYYYSRIKKIGDKYGFAVEYITDDILKLDKEGSCPYKDCKCNKKHLNK